MCDVVENGYKLACTGRIIPFTGLPDLSVLTKEEFAELKDTKVSMISQMQVKSSMIRIEDKLDELNETLGTAIKESLEVQKKLEAEHEACPVNEGSILNIIDEWWIETAKNIDDADHELGKRFSTRIENDLKLFFKTRFLSAGTLAKAGGAILVFLGILAGYIFTLTELFTK